MSPERSPAILRGKNYEAWNTTEHDFHSPRDLIRWAVLAPSAHNTQPWSFDVKHDSIRVSPNLERDLPVSDPGKREMYLSIGAAIANMKVAAHFFGLAVSPTRHPTEHTGTLATELSFKSGYKKTEEDEALFRAIPNRASNGFAHTKDAVPEEMRSFISALHTSRLHVSIIDETEHLAVIGKLMEQASKETMHDPAFAGELAEWVRRNKTTESDGIPGFAYGMSDFESKFFGPIVLSGKGVDEIAESMHTRMARETASVVVISTAEDTPEAWLEAGEQLQRLALKATSLGMTSNILAALIETGTFHEDLQEIAKTTYRPQVMFRMGFSENAGVHTPRRSAQEVVEVGFGSERSPIPSDKPKIFTLAKDTYTLNDVVRELGDITIKDNYADEYLHELIANIQRPDIDGRSQAGIAQIQQLAMERNNEFDGKWAYFPWAKTLSHIPSEDEFYQILFSRNNPSISPETQQALSHIRVGVQGLSIGSLIAKGLAVSGVRHLRIADHDEIASSNTPRMGGLSQLSVAENKTRILAQELYEFNPYLDLEQYRSGVHDGNREAFMKGLDVWYEHMDDLVGKIKGREYTREMFQNGSGHTITLMGTGLGHRPTIEMELPADEELFNGRLQRDVVESLKQSPTSFKEWVANAHQVMGLAYMPASVCRNFMNVIEGTQNFGSQLGSTGMVVAGAVAWYVEMIAAGKANLLPRHLVVPIEQPGTYDASEEERVRDQFHEVVFGVPRGKEETPHSGTNDMMHI